MCWRLQDAWERENQSSLTLQDIESWVPSTGPLGLPCLSSNLNPKYHLGLSNRSTKDQNLTLEKTPKPNLD